MRTGTKELMSRFGPNLLCVRYRYDDDRREHLKTVELVVQRHLRERRPECPASRPSGTQAGVAARKVALRIGWRRQDSLRSLLMLIVMSYSSDLSQATPSGQYP